MPTTRTDPIRNFKFEVSIYPLSSTSDLVPGFTPTNSGGAQDLSKFLYAEGSPISRLGFAAMSGLAVRNEMIPYREGGMNTHPHKMVGQTDFDPITLSRGVFSGTSEAALWNWQRFIHNWQSGANGSTGGADYRCDVIVRVFDHPHSNATYTDSASDNATNLGNPKLGIKIFNCWPGAYATGGLNAGDNSIIIQEMTLHNEGWYIEFDPSKISELPSLK